MSRSWLAERPGGATWSCADVCVIPFNFSTTEDEFAGAFEGSSGAMGSGALYGAPTVASYIELEGSPRYACQTCVGFPPGHPECLHVPWAQTFTSITDAIWYNIVTITTVGYGDIYPTSNFARFFAIFIIVAGVVTFLPIPLAIVGNTFSRVWLEKEQVKLRGILRQMLSEQGISPTDFTQAFVQFDTDGNGTIEREEFYDIVENHMNLGLSKKEMRAMWRCIDVDARQLHRHHLRCIDVADNDRHHRVCRRLLPRRRRRDDRQCGGRAREEGRRRGRGRRDQGRVRPRGDR